MALCLLVTDDPIDRALHGDLTSPPAPPPAATAPGTDPNACEAASLAWLVGRPKTEIPVPVIPARRRVVCTTCPMSDDNSSGRTTIVFDQATGLVTAVTCK
jgi:hypothetical protein